MFAITSSFPSRRTRRCVIPVVVVSLLTSCGDDPPVRPAPAIPVPVAAVAVTPQHDLVVVGLTLQMTATALDSNGAPLTGRAISWSTSDGSKATVNSSGLVTGVSFGEVTITATSEGKSGSSDILSFPVEVVTVEVTPQTATMAPGSTQQLTARALSRTGLPIPGRVVTWSSSDVSKATVNDSGLVTAVAGGSATITATSEGKSGSASITVAPTPAEK